MLANESQTPVVRKNAWTEDEDLLLASVVLEEVRFGKSTRQAFKIASEKIDRTPSACEFRWNNKLINQYRKAYEIAKESRSQVLSQTRGIRVETNTTPSAEVENPGKINLPDIDDVKVEEDFVQVPTSQQPQIPMDLAMSIQHIQDYISNSLTSVAILQKQLEESNLKNKELEQQLEEVTSQNRTLSAKLEKVTAELNKLETDYAAVMTVMDMARKMAVQMENEQPIEKPIFKMDANGNLERVKN